MHELKGNRVFIVEDNLSNMAVYSVLLKRSGAEFVRDYMNIDPVEMLAMSLPIDIILLDLNLRYQADGYGVFDMIKDNPELADIPIVAVSAADPSIEIPRAKEKGFNGFISKPINTEIFAEQLAAILHGEEIWSSGREQLKDAS